MLTSSMQYENAINSLSRSTTAKIVFGVFDVSAKDDAAPSINTIQPFTSINCLKDGIEYPEYNLATFEDGFFKLDGSFNLMPDDVNVNDVLGVWSSVQSGPDSLFQVQPVITILFDSLHSSLGIGLIFDSFANSKCSDFKVEWFNGVTLLATRNITGNTNVEAYVDENVQNYNKLVITFQKTDKPYRYLKLLEINFGVEEIFDADKIVSGSIIEELDPISSEISSNKLKCTLLNQDQLFNMLNPSGIFAYLQKRQPISVKSGLQITPNLVEYISLGTYYLSDWKNSNDLTATLEATDALGLLDKTIFYNSPMFANTPIEQALNLVLSDAGSFQLIVDPSVASEVVNGYIPIVSHRDALQMILVSCRVALKIERNGALKVFRPDYITPLKTIDYETILSAQSISQKELITNVDVTDFSYKLDAAASTQYQTTFDLTGTKTFTFPFDKPVDVTTMSTVITGSGSLSGVVSYSATKATMTIIGTGSLTVTITGKAYAVSSKIVSVALPALPAGEVAQKATVSENTLISGNSKALNVAQYMLDYYQKRIMQKFTFHEDPRLQAGDCVNVETMFSSLKSGVIEKHEVEFSPTLRSTLEVTG